MTPGSPEFAELQALLNAVCEEAATPEQMQRLEEVVLADPAAEAYYVQYMSFYADLIRGVAGPRGVYQRNHRAPRARWTLRRSRFALGAATAAAVPWPPG